MIVPCAYRYIQTKKKSGCETGKQPYRSLAGSAHTQQRDELVRVQANEARRRNQRARIAVAVDAPVQNGVLQSVNRQRNYVVAERYRVGNLEEQMLCFDVVFIDIITRIDGAVLREQKRDVAARVSRHCAVRPLGVQRADGERSTQSSRQADRFARRVRDDNYDQTSVRYVRQRVYVFDAYIRGGHAVCGGVRVARFVALFWRRWLLLLLQHAGNTIVYRC